jgi:hypothetical protein
MKVDKFPGTLNFKTALLDINRVIGSEKVGGNHQMRGPFVKETPCANQECGKHFMKWMIGFASTKKYCCGKCQRKWMSKKNKKALEI